LSGKLVGNNNGLDILFSIYPDTNAENSLSFTLQQVSRRKYYPDELQYLSKRIEGADNPIEREVATDNFLGFIVNRKKELLKMIEKFAQREEVNQRTINILVDESQQVVYNKDQSDMVCVGGPLGGGLLQLNEDLNKIEQNNQHQLLEFDAEDVGHPVDSVSLLLEFDKYIIETDDFSFLSPQIFPIKTSNHRLDLARATQYFQDEYQKLSMINDFSPLIESSFTAAEATLEANFLYFYQLPDVVQQKFDQYKMDRFTHYPNLLGIQNAINITQKSLGELEILGYGVVEDQTEYSLIHTPLYNGLNCFLLAECSFDTLYEYYQELGNDSDLRWQIKELDKKQNSISKIDAKNLLGIDPVIQELVGIKKIKSRISTLSQNRGGLEIPVGYVSFNLLESESVMETSFTRVHLPFAFLRVLIDLKNSLELILSGALESLSIQSQVISIYLGYGDLRFKIELRLYSQYLFDFLVYFVGGSLQEVRDLVERQQLEIDDEILDHLILPLTEQNYLQIKQRLPVRQILTQRQFHKYDTHHPLTTFVHEQLHDQVVPVLLKRILKEVTTYEEQVQDTLGSYPGKESSSNGYSSPEKENQGERKRQRPGFLNNDDYSTELLKLEREVNAFNPGMFHFIRTIVRRDYPDVINDSRLSYEHIRDIFHDMTIAIIDFGLTPVQWKFANNLQLWNSYQAQISYIRHSIIIELRTFLGDGYEGNDIDLLISHPFTSKLQYLSFHGSINGDEYVNLKRVHLSFIPLLVRHKDQLQESQTLDEILTMLEDLEEERRKKIQSELPSLPKG